MLASNANVTLEDAGTAPARLALGTTYDASAPGTFTCGKLYINGETWYYLDFPNTEITTAFSAYILNSYAGKTLNRWCKVCLRICHKLG